MKISFRDGRRRLDVEFLDGEQNAIQEVLFGVTSGEFFASRPVPSLIGTPSGTPMSGFGTPSSLIGTTSGTPTSGFGTPSVPVYAEAVPTVLPPSRSRPASVRWLWIAALMGVSVGLCIWSIRRTPIGQSSPPPVVKPGKFTPMAPINVPKLPPNPEKFSKPPASRN
jgi:hypothetical protein